MSSLSSDYPEVLSDLREQIAVALTKRTELSGVEVSSASQIVIEELRHHWGGQQIYVPKGLGFQLESRDLQIYREFNGQNLNELARKYDLTVKRLRQIVKEVRRQQAERRQIPMFPARKPRP